MADPARARKVAERIKVLIAQGLDTLVKDPRLGFVTITDVRVTGDLQQATVFYTVLGGEQERTDAAEVLQTYRGRLRSHMGKGLGIRLTPTLEFVPDALPEDAAHLEDIFRQVHERDAELAAGRTASGYAGDEDPYRKPRDAEPLGDEPDEDDEPGEDDLSAAAGQHALGDPHGEDDLSAAADQHGEDDVSHQGVSDETLADGDLHHGVPARSDHTEFDADGRG
ncbi:MAG TPA: 30S ribosome-binding factor RbfA [Ornithinicoccus sp.]|nr:30S ribosome-binding factor RbfA [Ornithinicoccus sp.]